MREEKKNIFRVQRGINITFNESRTQSHGINHNRNLQIRVQYGISVKWTTFCLLYRDVCFVKNLFVRLTSIYSKARTTVGFIEMTALYHVCFEDILPHFKIIIIPLKKYSFLHIFSM